MDDGRRRTLQYVALTGLSCLAASRETGAVQDGEIDQSPSSGGEPAGMPGEPTLTVETAVERDDGDTTLVVTGTVTADATVTAVRVSLGDRSTETRIDGDRTGSFEVTFSVGGGRTYEVSVTVETTGENLSSTQTAYVSRSAAGLDADRLVGAHYYPWYEMHGGHENWTEDCVETPELGEYRADDRSVIDQHLTWCLDHGIQWLSVSWWGQNSGSDSALSNALLEAEQFDELSFSILYETTRLREWDFDLTREGARDQLVADFEYLADEYFTEDNYLRFDGRPVVFFWISQTLGGDVQGAFEAIADAISVEPYVFAGLPFGQSLGTAPITQVADGITSYNPYTPRADIEAVFHDRYEQGLRTMNLSTRAGDLDFVPVAIPGFNDTEIPDSQREDNPVLSASPARFERVCDQLQPHLADSEAVLVTSFNEWYENTQIEPSERFGTAYLKHVADGLATADSGGFDPDGHTLTLEFDRTIVPAEINDASGDDRELAFRADQLTFHAGSEEVAAFDIGTEGAEPTFVRGVYGTESSDSRNWRWFGGVTGTTSIFVARDLADVTHARLRGYPIGSNEISASVSFDGEETDTVAFGERSLRTYELQLDG